MTEPLNWPLMDNNITRADLDHLIGFLQGEPILTQNREVRAFEDEWSKWLGVKYSVFVNSGASANWVTMAALKHTFGTGEVIVPTLTWVSDISSVIQNGFDPVFVDIDPKTLGMDIDQVIEKMNDKTRAVFLTHVLGYNGLNDRLIEECEKRGIPLIEDVCESHGATHRGQKLGSIGFVSNFSFYYAHHMSTVEGGMVSTNDEAFYEKIRMLRSHGMLREARSEELKSEWLEKYPELNPEFVFTYPAFNVRSSEMNAVIGRNQLKRLDDNNRVRTRNLKLFLDHLDSEKYRTEFELKGSCNYALTLVIRRPDADFCGRVMAALKDAKVEFRRGLSGGGNQVRQPYLKDYVLADQHLKYPEADHVHFYGFYIGNYPTLSEDRILKLCELLNRV